MAITIDLSPLSHPPPSSSPSAPNPRAHSNPTSGVKSEDLLHAKLIANALKRAKRCVVVTGAGVSVSAGIPDFRSANGLYNLVKSRYPTAVLKGKDLFDATLFRDPVSTSVFYTFMAELKALVDSANVTPTHEFVRKLEGWGKLMRCYTQNIDSIESRLALSTDLSNPKSVRVVQLHGDLDHVTCTHCKTLFPFNTTHTTTFLTGTAPDCPSCISADDLRTSMGKRSVAIGTLRPNVVLYNEHHAQGQEIAELAASDVRKRPDLLIVMGTSLKVDGIRRLVKDLARAVHSLKNGTVVLVNRTELGKEWDGVFDYFVKGDSDPVVEFLEREVAVLEETARVKTEKAALKLRLKEEQPSVASVFKAKKSGAPAVGKDVKGKKPASPMLISPVEEDSAAESDYGGMTDQENGTPPPPNIPLSHRKLISNLSTSAARSAGPKMRVKSATTTTTASLPAKKESATVNAETSSKSRSRAASAPNLTSRKASSASLSAPNTTIRKPSATLSKSKLDASMIPTSPTANKNTVVPMEAVSPVLATTSTQLSPSKKNKCLEKPAPESPTKKPRKGSISGSLSAIPTPKLKIPEPPSPQTSAPAAFAPKRKPLSSSSSAASSPRTLRSKTVEVTPVSSAVKLKAKKAGTTGKKLKGVEDKTGGLLGFVDPAVVNSVRGLFGDAASAVPV
ncbi:hypothetical protein HDV05_004692 [Chytridiales sp. JEL 0842]|nr:hypothetical protein HDV05_004692 [Chytridiales sp. JEL 0842]